MSRSTKVARHRNELQIPNNVLDGFRTMAQLPTWTMPLKVTLNGVVSIAEFLKVWLDFSSIRLT